MTSQIEPSQKPPSDATGHMAVMSREGDTKYHWNAKDAAQVDAAQAVFIAHRGQGYLAFRMNTGTQGEQMTEFDPSAEAILFVPPMQGG